MRNVKRVIVATALAAPLTLGFAGTAFAGTSYDQHGSYAGPDGADSYHVHSSTGHHHGDDHDGGSHSHYSQSNSGADADGAWQDHIRSGAHSDGDAYYLESSNMSGVDGAWNSETISVAGD
ncbi:hypothetical protein LO763_00625 [Glycomyces sp. A-F 0318]|uniref:hypothetical protein n=1 Tax=Glycomyces amatae TaxID=2881355 RepID=UPI001E47C031|nr:hypothetical protein [Glycomyces amatae]MCD0442129.1 hypothetical protein [Glycomyces amatae]